MTDKASQPELALNISRDKMTVTAEIKHFVEDHAVTMDAVQTALTELAVVPECVDREAIETMLAFGKGIVAQGRPAENGMDAVFAETFFIDDSLCPNIDTQDVAHYYQTKRYITVEVGETVMRRIPATGGVDGTNVLGKPIKAKKGKDPKFKKYPGTEVDGDENTLVAKVGGHPILQSQGVKIDETLNVRHADLTTGNINFDGSVVVNGDVMPQVSIAATGDVFIKGTVENATVEAGNNIVIGGGVISQSLPGVKEPPKITTKIKAGGELHAKFLTQTAAKATGDIKVANSVMNSELITEKSLLLGDQGGKGCLIGGTTLAAHSITANELGSMAYVETEIVCGDPEEARKSLANTSSHLHRRLREREQLKQILDRIKNDPAPQIGEVTINRREKINVAIKNLNKVLRKLRKTQTTLQSEIEHAEAAFVQINKRLYPKATVKINGERFVPNDERGKTRITCPEGNLKIE